MKTSPNTKTYVVLKAFKFCPAVSEIQNRSSHFYRTALYTTKNIFIFSCLFSPNPSPMASMLTATRPVTSLTSYVKLCWSLHETDFFDNELFDYPQIFSQIKSEERGSFTNITN